MHEMRYSGVRSDGSPSSAGWRGSGLRQKMEVEVLLSHHNRAPRVSFSRARTRDAARGVPSTDNMR